MKPNKNNFLSYFDELSTDDMGALIDKLTVTYEERLEQDKRRKKAEEYAIKIYNLITEAKQDDLNIIIGNLYIPDNFRVDVYV